ncbi:putative UDP-N-acetylglucosamine--peptide N-acetylglucosaminyltransferase SEC [Geobacter sp. OR-1]|uniref:tetratricopeptide repeat protein n=1 Tax=Geobacter sp. OR-1 TaxID=1266765 RepID=UPI0005430255|nr:tetratricopeptide repeat protein [Geobacter sp. OR-1]GAM09644.1 putative UDP-N-acetylglucosamine--peptide N-acetylglucosaminyltransferase SEC [Geobacter sp. OR-1]
MATTTSLGEQLFSLLSPRSGQNESLANNSLIAGVRMLQKNRPEDAVVHFKRALALNPDSIDAYNYLGNTYLQLNKNDDAIATFKKLAAMKPFDAEAKISLGNAYSQAKNFKEAELQYAKAVKLSPGSVTARYSLGQTYLLQDKLKEAETEFLKVTRMKPRDANAFYALGATYNKMEKYDAAIASLKQSLTLKRDFTLAETELGYAYAGKGDEYNLGRQITKLQTLDPSAALELQNATFKPKILNVDYGSNNPFYPQLGPYTPLAMLSLTDPENTLAQPNASKDFTVVFQFNTDMDPVSVQSLANWKISKASGGTAGYYNHGYTLYPQKQAALPFAKNVTYDPAKQQATVTFTLKQNASGDAVIDPSHLVFKFSGKDIDGTQIDTNADEYDGFAGKAF